MQSEAGTATTLPGVSVSASTPTSSSPLRRTANSAVRAGAGIALERDRRDSGLAEHDREVALAGADVDRGLDGLLARRPGSIASQRDSEPPPRLRADPGKRRDGLVDAVRERVDAESDVVEHRVDALPRHEPLRHALEPRPAMRPRVASAPARPARAAASARGRERARRRRAGQRASPRSGPRRRAEPRAARSRSRPAAGAARRSA